MERLGSSSSSSCSSIISSFCCLPCQSVKILPFSLWKFELKINDTISPNSEKTFLFSKRSILDFVGHTDQIRTIASFCSDGTRLISGSRDKTVKIWNVEDGN